jgi:hypothetical protein
VPKLSVDKRVEIISHLVEQCSVRGTARLCGVYKETVTDLLVAVGVGCRKLHDTLVKNLAVWRVETDELTAPLHTREVNLNVDGDTDPLWGHLWTYTAFATVSKLLIAFALFDLWCNCDQLPGLVADGVAIERKNAKDLVELLDSNTRFITFAGHYVPSANLPPYLASAAGNELSQANAFAIIWHDTRDGVRVSIRSQRDGGLDVSQIAKIYGGGGFDVEYFSAAPFEAEHSLTSPAMVGALHPAPKRILQICMSIGQWTRVLSSYEDLERLDVSARRFEAIHKRSSLRRVHEFIRRRKDDQPGSACSNRLG